VKTTAREGHEETETSRGATYKTKKSGPFLTLPSMLFYYFIQILDRIISEDVVLLLNYTGYLMLDRCL